MNFRYLLLAHKKVFTPDIGNMVERLLVVWYSMKKIPHQRNFHTVR